MYKVPTIKEIKAALERDGARFEVVSLFAGGGGSSLGYRMAGGKVLAINEFVPEAQNTYAANWPDTKIFKQDIRKLTGAEILEAIGKKPGELDILDGSPPCSAFSMCGKQNKLWGKEKKYSDVTQKGVENLFFEFIRILEDIKPKVFVAENVPGLNRGVSIGFLNEFFSAFRAAGYKVVCKELNAKYLGVPQDRRRLIFVGVRADLWRPEFEENTHPKPKGKIITAGAALKDVLNTEKDLAAADIKQYKIYKKLLKILPGKRDKNFYSLYKVNPRSVCPTITALGCSCKSVAGVCHWKNRKFTIPELKRLTSVPDDYILTGSYEQQGERCGRMVPPLMMKAVAENIYEKILRVL